MKMNKVILLMLISVLMIASLPLTIGIVNADTAVQVTWSSPNPDIQVSGTVAPLKYAWVGVSGSGGLASGVLELSTGWPWVSAYQTANFEGGTYTAGVVADATISAGPQTTSHSFEVRGADSSGVTQQAIVRTGFTRLEGFQSYSAVGADLVIAGGLVEADHWTWDTPQRVTYTGNAEGNVVGSQGSLTETYAALGFGAGIQGTEGTTIFNFDILTPTDWPIATVPAGDPAGTIHTVVIASGFTNAISGEAHTWLESSGFDANFNWIE